MSNESTEMREIEAFLGSGGTLAIVDPFVLDPAFNTGDERFYEAFMIVEEANGGAQIVEGDDGCPSGIVARVEKAHLERLEPDEDGVVWITITFNMRLKRP